jgi:hypothetical protein
MRASILFIKCFPFIFFLEKNPGQEVRTGSSRKTLEINGNTEAVFRPESLWIFSVDFRLASRSFRQETPVNHWKKSENIPVGILLPCFIIFRRFPTGSSDFSVSTSFRPVSMKFRLFPAAGIIDLGMACLCFMPARQWLPCIMQILVVFYQYYFGNDILCEFFFLEDQ